MAKNIWIEEIPHNRVAQQRIELVERKGLGHPDTIADGISEAVSRALCKKYREKFGAIAHHNTDEVQIIGGQSRPAYGGGEMVQPIYILLGGRATHEYEGKTINVHGTALKAARNYLDETVRHLDTEEHVILDSRIGEGSADLTEMYARDGEVPLANDTSFGIGHAPLSDTEKLVLQLEQQLNDDTMHEKKPWLGEDIKVMGYRDEGTINLTVAAAFVDEYIDDLDGYRSRKDELHDTIGDIAADLVDQPVDISINTADSYENDSVYITRTGTSAEMGDDGSTGRGNRVSGLITPKRAMSLEASSGKNPVAHIGKIYNVLSHYIADQLVAEHNSVDEATIKILSQIGKPINQPQIASIRVDAQDGVDSSLESDIKQTVGYWLDNIPEVMEKVIDGTITTY